MNTLPVLLVVAASAIALALGLAHVLFTFHGPKLTPRDPELLQRMQGTSPVITRQTTMWKAWVGFNASHGLGLITFGAVYGYLALVQPHLLFQSFFLLGFGAVVLLGYVFLARQYFFRTPFRAVSGATAMYCIALVVNAIRTS